MIQQNSFEHDLALQYLENWQKEILEIIQDGFERGIDIQIIWAIIGKAIYENLCDAILELRNLHLTNEIEC